MDDLLQLLLLVVPHSVRPQTAAHQAHPGILQARPLGVAAISFLQTTQERNYLDQCS